MPPAVARSAPSSPIARQARAASSAGHGAGVRRGAARRARTRRARLFNPAAVAALVRKCRAGRGRRQQRTTWRSSACSRRSSGSPRFIHRVPSRRCLCRRPRSAAPARSSSRTSCSAARNRLARRRLAPGRGIVDSTGVLELVVFLEQTFGVDVLEIRSSFPRTSTRSTSLTRFVDRQAPAARR